MTTKMKYFAIYLPLMIMVLALSGCGIPQDQYDQLKSELTSFQQQLEELKAQAAWQEESLGECKRGLVSLEQSDVITCAASKVVAASNSLDKSRADYACDGAGDQEEIQAAIDAIQDTGGMVLLLEGTYSISVPIKLRAYITLKGQGLGTLLKLADEANCNIIEMANPEAPPYDRGTKSVDRCAAIQNLQIDGNRANQTARSRGFSLANAENLMIEGCYIHDCRDEAIHLSSVADVRVTIVNNWFIDNGKILYSEVFGLRVINNYFRKNDQGIELRPAANIFIGNHLRDTGYDDRTGNSIPSYGLYVYGGYAHIIGNFIVGSGAEGIILSKNATASVVEGNIVVDNGLATPNTYAGIKIEASHSVIQGNVSRNEMPDTQKYGILLGGDEHHNIVKDNILTFNGTAGLYGGDRTDIICDNLE